MDPAAPRWVLGVASVVLITGLAISGLPLTYSVETPAVPHSPPPKASSGEFNAAGSPPRLTVSSSPTFLWSTAQIFYGPGDPTGLLFGEGAVMAVDDRLQNTVSFGGRALDGLSGITLVYENSTNGTWWYAGSPVSPTPRANSTFATFSPGDLAVMFGGVGNLSSSRALNDTWVYYFFNETWVNVSQKIAPPARENAAFAIDPLDGIGLLVGGINPAYSAGGSTGAIVWNDTWILNLTTFSWTPVVIPGSPPARYGSSMVWDPVAGEFVLFGGCDTSRCSGEVWTYSPGASAWRHPALSGQAPSGRGSAAFAWDPADNGSLLFGGFNPGADGPIALGGTFYLDPAVTTWSTVSSVGGPPPTYGAASAFSDYPGCIGFWVQGGSPALDAVITNDSVLEPTGSLRPNCFTPFGGGTGGGPPPACSNTSAHVEVQVRDALTGFGLAGSDVVVSGSCGTAHGTTGVGGFLNLSEAAPDVLTVTANRVGYHGANLTDTYTGAPGDVVVVPLNPLPSLSARVFGTTLNGTRPLANASVAVNGALLVGRSSASGWVNASALPDNSPLLTISASAIDFSTVAKTVAYPFTGTVFVNLTVLAYGLLEVDVRDNLTGAPITAATIGLSFVDPLGANTSIVSTGPDGDYVAALRAGNYSVSVGAVGFFSNGTATPVFHDWIQPTVVRVNLSRVYGSDVHVHVFDSVTGNPIAQATVTFGGSHTLFSDTRGWANATNLGPPGLLRIEVNAWGYYPNSTTVSIRPYLVLHDVQVPMRPAPPCSPFASCPPKNSSGPPPLLSLLPPPGLVRSILLVAPLLLAVVGALVVVYPRLRSARTAASGRPPVAAHSSTVGRGPPA